MKPGKSQVTFVEIEAIYSLSDRYRQKETFIFPVWLYRSFVALDLKGNTTQPVQLIWRENRSRQIL